jgi:hypothetical protein
MSIALDQAINYKSKYEIKVDSKTLAPKKNKGYSKSRNAFRRAVTMLLVFSIMAMGFLGFSGAIPKAQAADDPFGICKTINKNGVWFNNSTAGYMGPMNTPSEGKITAYEKYGMSGTVWTVWRGPIDSGSDSPPYETDISNKYKSENAYFANGVCVPAPELLTAGTANTMFLFAKVTVFVSNLVYQVAFEGKDNAINPLQKQIAKVINPGNGERGLKDTLYLEFLIPVIMLSALYLGYVGLIKRRSSEAISSGIWMIGSAITGLWLLINPMTIPNFTNTAINAVTSGIMTGITSSSSDGLSNVGVTEAGKPAGPSALCAVNEDAAHKERKITRLVQCSLWYSFIYVPWASGQYGISPTTQNQAERDILNQHASLMSSGVSLNAKGTGDNVERVNWPLYQLDKQVGNANQEAAWAQIPIAQLGQPGDGKGGTVNTAWKGDPSGGLITKAFFSLIAAIGVGIMIISLGMSMIVFELGLVILMMLAPLFFLVGVHPGFGRRLALKWVETMLSLTLKRIVLSVLLGVMITFYSIAIAIPESTLPWYGTLVLIVAISIAGMKYKDTVTDMFGNINLGGGGPIQEPDSKMGAMAKGAMAGVVGGVMGGTIAGRASSTASVIRNGKTGTDSSKNGSGGAATQRAKVSKALEGIESNGFGGGTSAADASSSPAVSRVEPSFEGAPTGAGAGVAGVAGLAGTGSEAGDPKRKDTRIQEKQAAIASRSQAKRQKLEERLDGRVSKTSNTARRVGNFNTIAGAAFKGAVMGRSGADVTYIASSTQAAVLKKKMDAQKQGKKDVAVAGRRQTEYTQAWEEYNAATTEADKKNASEKIKATYGQMSAGEKKYLKGVGKLNEQTSGQMNKAAGLPKKPAQPTSGSSSSSNKVAPRRRYVDPTAGGGLPPRRPQP